MNLWLVPVDERSFQRTLAEPADLSDWEDPPDDFPERARVWGVRTDPEQGGWERNRRNLDRMEPGDPLVIYRNSESKYTATGRAGPRCLRRGRLRRLSRDRVPESFLDEHEMLPDDEHEMLPRVTHHGTAGSASRSGNRAPNDFS